MKFLLLHEAKNDDGIKAFFYEVWELYVKVRIDEHTIDVGLTLRQTMLNPFHTAHTPIRSSVFDTRVRASAKKYL
jgi:trafficking protein particle complex subunit 2